VKDTILPDFTNLADFYLCNLTEANIKKYMEENIVPKIRHPEIKNPEELNNILGLLMDMIRINTKKRITINEVIIHPFFKGEDKNDKSKKEEVKNISLQDVQFDYYIGVYIIIDYLKEHFEKECIGIFFMALDIFLRNIYELTMKFEEFESLKNSFFKYFDFFTKNIKPEKRTILLEGGEPTFYSNLDELLL
jgi:serine/threonine protein kinase